MVKNKGAALITVLMIVFIIMAIITNITVSNYRTIRLLSNQKIEAQASLILIAATAFGRAGLGTSASTSKIDTLNDIWAQPLPKSNVFDNIFMSGYIIDEQSKFNVNDLVQNGVIDKNILKKLAKLFEYLNIPTSMASAIASYITAPQYQDDIMMSYTTGSPAYRPAGRPLIDLSELILVKNMQADWVYKLNQYLTAIPQNVNYQNESSAKNSNNHDNEHNHDELNDDTKVNNHELHININTASAEVIAAKSGIPLDIAQRIVNTRNATAFKNNGEITKFLNNNGIILTGTSINKIDVDVLDTTSQYFTIHAIIDSDDYQFKLISLVFRQNRSGQWPQILWQHPE